MKSTTEKTYRSTMGRLWLILVILLIATLLLLQYFFLNDTASFLATGLATLAILATIYFSLQYQISNHTLKIKSLFSVKEIDIFQISSLSWVHSFNYPPTAFAFSEKRLRVVYSYGEYVDISPQQAGEFIETLLAVNPMVRYQHEAMVRE